MAAQHKFIPPPCFSAKVGENAVDWLERYSLTGRYNHWGNQEMRAHFVMYLEGMARKWYLFSNLPRDWEDQAAVPATANAIYHSSVHSSTQETPFFLLYGRDPYIPIHNLLDAIPQSNRSASDFVSLRMESLRIVFQRTKEENEKAREQQRAVVAAAKRRER
jgi:hypothetical protein